MKVVNNEKLKILIKNPIKEEERKHKKLKIFGSIYSSFFYLFISLIITLIFQLRCPEGQVVSDQLHNCSRILVLVLLYLFDISNSIIEGLDLDNY